MCRGGHVALVQFRLQTEAKRIAHVWGKDHDFAGWNLLVVR